MNSRSRRTLWCAFALAWMSVACIPSFEEVECYSELDCLEGSVCANGLCVVPDGGSTSLDGSAPTDIGPTADSGPSADVGPAPDSGPTNDAGPVTDSGPMSDSGPAPDADISADGGTDGGTDATPGDSGPGIDAGVVANPDPLSFGDVQVGCPPPVRTVSVENRTPASITLNGATLGGGASSPFAVVSTTFPLSIAPGGSQSVSVRFNPASVSPQSDQLLIGHSTVGSPLFVGLQGNGVIRPETVELFTQLPGSIDILLVLDDSGSMGPLQQQLGQQLGQMFTALSNGGWDFQVGVTTTDVSTEGPQGALLGNPAVITNNTPNAQTVLGQRVLVGSNGSGDEQGLEAGYLALAGAAPSSFIRPAAAFLMLYLSDEADHSPHAIADYYNQILALKTDPSRARANSIVGTVAGGCNTVGGPSAQHGIEFITVSNNTQGVVTNICFASWTPAITTFPQLPRFNNFTLTGTPDPTTIQVFVNGIERPNAEWSFDAASRRISFDAASVPPHSATIQVRYSVSC